MNVLVAGGGPVGSALRAAFADAGLAVGRWSRARGIEAASFEKMHADSIVLAVPDRAIGAVAERLLGDGIAGADTVLLHTAGAVSPARAFENVRASINGIGLLHPLRALAGGPDDARFAGTVFGVAGDEPGRAAAVALARAVGARPLLLDERGLARYHAAAALASNHTVALVDAAARLLVGEGLDRRDAERALAALLASVAANVASLGLPAALTGPIARGDADTVARHLAALPPEAAALYRATAGATVELARGRGLADPEALARIESLVDGREPAEPPPAD